MAKTLLPTNTTKSGRAKQLALLLLIAVFSAALVVTNARQKTFAQEFQAVFPEQQAQVYTAFWYLRACSQIVNHVGWHGSTRSEADINNGDIFYQTQKGKTTNTRAGFLLSPLGVPTDRNGWVECATGEPVGAVLRGIGIDPVDFFISAGTHVAGPSGYDLVDMSESDRTNLMRAEFQRRFPGIDFNNDMSPAMQYFSLLATFYAKCDRGNADQGGGMDIPIVQSDGTIVNQRFFVNTAGDEHSVGYGMSNNNDNSDRSGGKQNCETIVNNMRSFAESAAQEVATLVAQGHTPPTSGITTRGTTPGDDDSCESKGGPMAWIMCPAILAIDGGINWVDSRINALLTIDQNYFDNDGMRSAWANIRNIAYIILVPIMLVMVISTALGYEFVSAYTIKRAVPRLVAATIFISLSYPICVLLINLFNAIGSGAVGLIMSPFEAEFGNMTLARMFNGNIITGLVTGVAAAAAILLVLIFFGSTILLLVVTAFFILLLRQIFIVVLLLLAPLAILSWIFPGNDRLWKLWWGSFSKLLMMYPIIMALIAAGRVFAFTIWQSNPAGLDGAILQPIMTLAAYMIPYAFIPFTFKLAGGTFATLAGIVNDREKGLFDRQRQRRAEKIKRAGQNRLFNPNSNLGRLNNLAGWSVSPGANAKVAIGNSRLARTRLGRRMGVSNVGKGILGDVLQGKIEDTDKLSGTLSKLGMNDMALRALSTGIKAKDRNGNEREVKAWDGTAQDLQRVVAEMQTLDGTNYQLGAKSISENASILTSAYRNEEYGRGSLKAAAGLALASQGFAKADDIVNLTNELNSEMPGFGNVFKTSAELMSGRGGGFGKPGYTGQVAIRGDEAGQIVRGGVAARATQFLRYTPSDIASGKAGQLKEQFIDSRAIETILSANTSAERPDEDIVVVEDYQTGEKLKVSDNKRRATLDNIIQAAYGYNTPAETAATLRNLLGDLETRDPRLSSEIEEARRRIMRESVDPREQAARAAGQAPPEPPQQGGASGG